MQARWKTAVPASTSGTAPSRPNSDGMWTVNPASRTQRLKRATCGLMPGISVMTITAGPDPATYTFLVTPSSVISRAVKPSSLSSSFMFRLDIHTPCTFAARDSASGDGIARARRAHVPDDYASVAPAGR